MKKTTRRVLCCSLAVMFLSAGCASIGGVGYGLSAKNLGKQKVIEKSGSRPDWVFNRPMFVKGGVLYASGSFTDAPNLGKGLEVAAKLAQAKMAESIRMRLKDDFTYASEGMDVESTILERVLNTTTDEMVIRGFFQNSVYYEKKQTVAPTGTKYLYDCYALVEITRENYMDAVDNSINANMSGSVSKAFREKVDERQRAFFKLGEIDEATKQTKEELQ